MSQNGPTLAGLGAIMLWGLLALLTARTADVPPFLLTALTFSIGGGAGIAIVAARGGLRLIVQPPAAWALGVGGLFLYHAVYFAALKMAPPEDASLIAYLWPLLIVLFSALLPGETLRANHVIGALTGFSGVAVLAFGKSALAFDAKHLAGYGLALACAFIWSGYSVLSRRLADVPSEAVAGFCLAVAALAAACHAAFESPGLPRDASVWIAIIALGLGPVGAAFFLWDHGMKRGDIRFLGAASYGAPVISTIALVVTGVAAPGWSLGLACALIVCGAAVASKT